MPDIINVDYGQLELRVLALMARNGLEFVELFNEMREHPLSIRDTVISRVADVYKRAGIDDKFPLIRVLEKALPSADEDVWEEIRKIIDVDDEVLKVLTSGTPHRLIEAIKLHRGLSGLGLAQSKREVENIIRSYKICVCEVDVHSGMYFRGYCGQHQTREAACDDKRDQIRKTLSDFPTVWKECLDCKGAGKANDSYCKKCHAVGFVKIEYVGGGRFA